MKNLFLFCIIACNLIHFESLKAQVCTIGNVSFSKQSDVDSFPIKYPGCTEIKGNISIYGDVRNLYGFISIVKIHGNLNLSRADSLIDMSGLGDLNEIDGNLDISFGFSNTSLVGLDNLRLITGTLQIYNNRNLSNLNGLNSLETIGGALRIFNNLGLINLNGLDQLSEIDDYVLITSNDQLIELSALTNLKTINQSLEISYNKRIKNFNGLDGLQYIGNSFTVQGLDSLIDFKGLESLFYIKGSLMVSNNKQLVNFIGLNNLTTIGSSFQIYTNDSLINFNGLENLTTIGYFLIIVGNSSLKNLEGLSGLKNLIFGDVTVSENKVLSSLKGMVSIKSLLGLSLDSDPNLSSLEGLENLEYINSFSIDSCMNLKTLDGLVNLQDVGSLEIIKNPVLWSLNGLANLKTISGLLTIEGNSLLSDCSVKPVCDKVLLAPSGYSIKNNLKRCNSDIEILNECQDASNSSNGSIYFDISCNGIDINDNPLSNILLFNTIDNKPISCSQRNGYYEIFLPKNANLTYKPDTLLGFTYHPDFYSITSDSTIKKFSNKHFRYCAKSNFHEVQVDMSILSLPTPGNEYQYFVSFQNRGNQSESVSLNFEFLNGIPATKIAVVDAAKGIVNGNSISWPTSFLEPFQQRSFAIILKVDPSVVPGSPIIASVKIELPAGKTDIKMDNNISTIEHAVLGNDDPIEKTVNKKVLSESEFTSGAELEYQIRFQNTGTVAASYIEIVDTLPPYLDISTFKMISCSHTYHLSFPAANIVKWQFEIISLGDKFNFERYSHLSIKFSIRIIKNIPLSTIIVNRAAIAMNGDKYIITNEATSRYTVGVNELSEQNANFFLVKNPVEKEAIIRYELLRKQTCGIEIFDMFGVSVKKSRTSMQSSGMHEERIDLTELVPGPYLVRLMIGREVYYNKLIKN